MTIKGILFDKDGTLIEANGTWVPVYKAMLAKEMNADESQVVELMCMAGYDVDTDGFKAGSVLAAGTIGQLVDIWWPQFDAAARREKVQKINRDYAEEARLYMKPLMDLAPIFDELRAMDILLGVATNDVHSSATYHMRALGVHDYFAHIIGADSVEIAKPSGQMIALFAERTGLQLHEIAMVGDNSHDMEEAQNGGAGLAIGVLTGNAKHSDIAHLADHVLGSVADIPNLLKQLA